MSPVGSPRTLRSLGGYLGFLPLSSHWDSTQRGPATSRLEYSPIVSARCVLTSLSQIHSTVVHVWRAPSKGKVMVMVEVVMMVIEGMLVMVVMVINTMALSASHLFCTLSAPGSPLSTVHAPEPKWGMEA